jgi:hypothetical protein
MRLIPRKEYGVKYKCSWSKTWAWFYNSQSADYHDPNIPVFTKAKADAILKRFDSLDEIQLVTYETKKK